MSLRNYYLLLSYLLLSYLLIIIGGVVLSGCAGQESRSAGLAPKGQADEQPGEKAKVNPSTESSPHTIVIPPKTQIRPKTTPTPTSETRRKLTLFLPEKNGKLQQKTVTEPAILAAQRLSRAESALTLLFLKAPQLIPAGTQLTQPIRKNMNVGNPGVGAYWEVSLNRKFQASRLWNDRKIAQLAFDAITTTAGHGIEEEIQPTYPVRVRLLIEGEVIRKLGSLDVSEPVPMT